MQNKSKKLHSLFTGNYQLDSGGSALILTIIVLVNALLIVTTITTISIIEQKASAKTRNSTPAFQAADSAMEWALKKLQDTSLIQIDELCADGFDAGSGACDPDIPGLATDTEIYFIDSEGKVITDESESPNAAVSLRTVGRVGSGEERVSRSLQVHLGQKGPQIEEDSDLMILMDFSNSMTESDKSKEKTAVKGLIQDLQASGLDYNVGIVVFGNSTDTIGLIPSSDPNFYADLEEHIDSTTITGETHTNEALEEARDELLSGTNNRNGTNSQAMILITDGAPNDSDSGCPSHYACTGSSTWDDCDAQIVMDTSDDIKNQNIKIIAIGIGLSNLSSQQCTDYSNDLMQYVASFPNWYLSVDAFSSLNDILDGLQ